MELSSLEMRTLANQLEKIGLFTLVLNLSSILSFITNEDFKSPFG